MEAYDGEYDVILLDWQNLARFAGVSGQIFKKKQAGLSRATLEINFRLFLLYFFPLFLLLLSFLLAFFPSGLRGGFFKRLLRYQQFQIQTVGWMGGWVGGCLGGLVRK